MKIDMNKDFEREFKGDVWKGLAGKELFWGALALLISGFAVILIWYFTGIPINVCVYFGLPIMAPIAAIGIIKYQGSNLKELIKDFCYFYNTRELSFDSEEYEDNPRIFTMGSQCGSQKRKERK